MDCSKLLNILDKGEDSQCQFKQDFRSINNLAVEISAFANSNGGMIIIGATDSGDLKGIHRKDVSRLNQWISNASSNKIEPPLFVSTEILMCDNKRILVIHVQQGKNKPYSE
jgi:ATP-dependent DNA helicase RecG